MTEERKRYAALLTGIVRMLERHRAMKSYAVADELRDIIKKAGLEIQMAGDGSGLVVPIQ